MESRKYYNESNVCRLHPARFDVNTRKEDYGSEKYNPWEEYLSRTRLTCLLQIKGQKQGCWMVMDAGNIFPCKLLGILS